MKYITIDYFGFRCKDNICTVSKIEKGIVYFTWDDEDKSALLYSGVTMCGEDIFNKKFSPSVLRIIDYTGSEQ